MWMEGGILRAKPWGVQNPTGRQRPAPDPIGRLWGVPPSCAAPVSPASGLFASMAMVLLGGVRASRLLFRRLLWDVLRSPIGFFEQTPVGNLLNRFSKETDTVDVDIPDKFRLLLTYTFGLLEVILVVTVATPLAILAILPLLVLYAGFQVRRHWGCFRSAQPGSCLWAAWGGIGTL